MQDSGKLKMRISDLENQLKNEIKAKEDLLNKYKLVDLLHYRPLFMLSAFKQPTTLTYYA